MRRALITGVDGFTGRYLAPLLAERGYHVEGLVQHALPGGVDGAARLHEVDLQDGPRLVAAVAEASPDCIIHLAGISFVVGDPAAMYSVNLMGSRRLLEAAALLPRRPEAILLASSANVYGNAREGVLEETTPPHPANDYAVAKLAMEHIAWLFRERLPILVCRPFNYTGIGQAETFLLPKIVNHLRRGDARIELGNLDVARDFSDVRDVAATYAELIALPEAIGQTVNVCSGRAWTLREVVAMSEAICGRTVEVVVNPDFVRRNEVRLLRGSRARLDALLGKRTKPGTPLAETLRWMIEAPQPGSNT